jgi:hypothetical protein
MQKVHVSTITLALAFGLLCSPGPTSASQATSQADLGAVVRGFLWPSTSAELAEARARLDRDERLRDVDRLRWHEFEAIMRRGRVSYPALGSDEELIEMSVETLGGREVPVLVRLPSDYDPEQQWPLMFAMHGGPPGSVEGAVAGAGRMVSVWTPDAERAGWIIASPALQREP